MRLNRRITRLSSELETLQFMQDRLERQLDAEERSARSAERWTAPLGKSINYPDGGKT